MKTKMVLYYNLNWASMSVISCFIFSISLISSTTAAAPNNGDGLTIDLIHPDSPISPLFNPNETRFDRAKKSVINSFNRYKYFKSQLIISSGTVDAPLRTIGNGYIMRVGIGTPPTQVWALADTGSDLSWTQCPPCKNCFKQDDPLFNPAKSSTYKKIPCGSDQCRMSPFHKPCSGGDCTYSIDYGDHVSHTRGTLSTESFTFSSGGNVATFKSVIFGCGHDNVGKFMPKMSGIIGLGRGLASIVRQLDKTFAGTFAYCLTSWTSTATSKISFGSDALIKGDKVVSTPILPKKNENTHYFLSLEGITVGNKKLSVSSDGRPMAPTTEGNVLIDSGSTITLLPKDLFEKVEAELKKVIKAKPVKSPPKMPLCYQTPSSGRLIPLPVTAHFKGADVPLPEEGLVVELSNGMACVTIAPADDFGIFGSFHQVNYLVGYDLVGQKISFQKTDCSKFGRPERN